jgi:L-iditol 2-dehydrogenase
MRIVELSAPRTLRLAQGDPPEPGPGEVRVRVGAVGLCGSDLHNYSEGGVGDTPAQYPMVLGHEPAGFVDRLGLGVSGWAPGDRAVLEPALYCYHCEYCMSGRHNICENIRFLSTGADPGFLRDYVILPAANLLALPGHLGMAEGALVEPLAVALHSLEFAAIRPGDTVVVLGAGPIGLLTVALLKIAGAGRIWSVDPVSDRRALASQVGATAAVDPASADPVAEILRDTRRRGVDVAIDCATRGLSTEHALLAVRNGGRVVITGIPPAPQLALNASAMRRKELAIFNVRRSNHESEAALRLLAEAPKQFAPILTHSRPIEEISEAFRIFEAYADGVGKMTIDVNVR